MATTNATPVDPVDGKQKPKWDKYQCGKTLYWRVRSTSGTSAWTPTTVTCPTIAVCDGSGLNMTYSPANAAIGSPITFYLSATGGQGSTWLDDTFSSFQLVSCPNGAVDPLTGLYKPGLNWGSTVCSIKAWGTLNWTHTWKNCAPNDCYITGPECSKTAEVIIAGPPTPTPTPRPTRTPTPSPIPSLYADCRFCNLQNSPDPNMCLVLCGKPDCNIYQQSCQISGYNTNPNCYGFQCF